MRVGLFGGTFDPLHMAHLVFAEQAREQLDLDEVVFIPANVSPHKLHARPTLGKKRFEMIEAAIAGNPAFSASHIEINRAGTSYTADTVETIAVERPGDDLFLLVGADTLRDFASWHEPERILRRCRLAVALRPGAESIDPSDLGALLGAGELDALQECLVRMPLLDVSGTDVRRRVAEGRSIRYLVPPAVEAYIAANGFYRPARDGVPAGSGRDRAAE